MTCQEAEALIHKELDGELPEQELRLLTAHARECPRCRSRRENLHQLTAVARELPAPSAPPAGLAKAVARSVRRRRWFRRAVVAGLAVAAGILLLVMVRPQSTSIEPAPGPALPTQRAGPGDVRPPAALPDLSPEAFRAWLEAAWEKAAGEAVTEVPSVEIALIPADYEWQGALQRDLRETKSTLVHVARSVGERVFPFELRRTPRRPQNG